MNLKLQVIHLPMSSIPTFESISSPPPKPPLPWCPSARQMGVIASLYNLSLPDSQPARQPPCLAIDGGHCVAADRLMNTSSSSPCPDACFHDPSLSTPTLEWQERKPSSLAKVYTEEAMLKKQYQRRQNRQCCERERGDLDGRRRKQKLGYRRTDADWER